MSLRKLALALTMAVLVSASLFLPYVKADVQLTPEFVEPVKNQSFEDIGCSVCECPPWASNNGGWRELRSDVNEDGEVNVLDMKKVQLVYMGYITDPYWVSRCDVNGDGTVNILDVKIVRLDWGKKMGVDAFCLDGEHSWYTSGGGDYQMWQWLDSDVMGAVKGQQVMFSFWFLPKSVSEDGSQNYARAEIYYDTPASPDGGGCPYVFLWDGTQYVADNNILPASEDTPGLDVDDYYLLEGSPVPKGWFGVYSILIREFENEHSYIDQVKLLAVDHESDVNVAVTATGDILTYKDPVTPVSAIDSAGNDLVRLVNATEDGYFEGDPGNYLMLDFGSLNISEGARLVLRADMKSPIHVQVMGSSGEWVTVADVTTRVNWSTDIIDLSGCLPDANGELKVRLYFTGSHKVDYVGLDASSQAAFEVHVANLISATHSAEGNVKNKLMQVDGDYAEIPSGDQVRLEYGLPENDTRRDFILYSRGRYASEGGNPTVVGDWVYPTETKWYNAFATAFIPLDTTSISVRIHGKPDFKAWVDIASLSIYTNALTTTSKGDLSVSANIYSSYSTYIGPEQPDWIAGVSAGLYAKSEGDYRIMAIELKVSLVPNDQHGELSISYCGQTNNKDYDVDPAAGEGFQNTVIDVATIAIKILAGAAISKATGLVGTFFIAPVVGGVIGVFMEHFRSNADDPYANAHLYPGTDYYIREFWGYPTGWDPSQGHFVRYASGHYGFKWLFYADTGTSFQIQVTASVHWGILQFSGKLGAYHLVDAGWTSVSTSVIINA